MKVRLFLVLRLLLCTVTIHAQTAYYKVTEQSGFPVFEGPSAIASEKINFVIQWKCLHKLIGQGGSDVFGQLDDWHTFSGYDVLRNDERALSVRITWEGCGAYCEHYDEYFSFSSSSGNLIDGSHLFQTSEIPKLRSDLSQVRNGLLQEEIESIKNDLAGIDSGNHEDSVTLAMQLEMYEWCVQARDENYVNEKRFYLKDASIWLVEDRCSNHAMRGIDDLDQFHLEVSPGQFTNVFSDFGKYILRLSPEPVNDAPRLTIYSGTIAGKYPIQFFSFEEGGGTNYMYCYKKYGTIIELVKMETADKAALILQESDQNGNPNGTFKLTGFGKGLRGQYINATGKEMRVELELRK